MSILVYFSKFMQPPPPLLNFMGARENSQSGILRRSVLLDLNDFSTGALSMSMFRKVGYYIPTLFSNWNSGECAVISLGLIAVRLPAAKRSRKK
jgi:hypothetical protein